MKIWEYNKVFVVKNKDFKVLFIKNYFKKQLLMFLYKIFLV